MSTEKEVSGVEKILGEPVFLGHDTNAKVVRAQLLLVSALTIAYMSMGLNISNDSSFLGIRFTNLNEGHIQAILLILLIYLAIHFAWLSFDAFVEWKLRLTGTKSAFSIGDEMSFSNDIEDYPKDPRQSTLYNFYLTRMRQNLIDVQNTLSKYPGNADHADIRAVRKYVDSVEQQLNSPRVAVSLKRFDNWFKYFAISQNLRWFALEFSLPLLLSILAISLILFH